MTFCVPLLGLAPVPMGNSVPLLRLGHFRLRGFGQYRNRKPWVKGRGARIFNVSAAKNLYDEAQKLSPEERSILALKLLDSVGESEESIERAWSVEIARRIEDIDAGRAKLSPWSEVKKRIFGT